MALQLEFFVSSAPRPSLTRRHSQRGDGPPACSSISSARCLAPSSAERLDIGSLDVRVSRVSPTDDPIGPLGNTVVGAWALKYRKPIPKGNCARAA